MADGTSLARVSLGSSPQGFRDGQALWGGTEEPLLGTAMPDGRLRLNEQMSYLGFIPASHRMPRPVVRRGLARVSWSHQRAGWCLPGCLQRTPKGFEHKGRKESNKRLAFKVSCVSDEFSFSGRYFTLFQFTPLSPSL